MIRITKQSDYGILLLAHLAKPGLPKLFSARDLAAEASLPLPMVSKILKLLMNKGLVVSQRGVNGGYRLARPANDISVAEVIDAVEGPFGLTECVESTDGQCGLETDCLVRGIWQRINYHVRAALEVVSMAEMIDPKSGHTPKFVDDLIATASKEMG